MKEQVRACWTRPTIPLNTHFHNEVRKALIYCAFLLGEISLAA